MALRSATVVIDTESGIRPTEVVADLRNAVEAMYSPMRCVAFWDETTGGHTCTEEVLGGTCPHGGFAVEQYHQVVQRSMKSVLEVVFPHAGVRLYLR